MSLKHEIPDYTKLQTDILRELVHLIPGSTVCQYYRDKDLRAGAYLKITIDGLYIEIGIEDQISMDEYECRQAVEVSIWTVKGEYCVAGGYVKSIEEANIVVDYIKSNITTYDYNDDTVILVKGVKEDISCIYDESPLCR